MKSRVLPYFFGIAAALAIVWLGIWRMSTRNDPSFNGRRLSVSVYDLLDPTPQRVETSSNVIAHFGVEAVPFLRGEITRDESWWERTSAKLKMPLGAHRMKYGRQLAVCRAIRFLGTNAVSLNSELTPLVQSRFGTIREAALEALFSTGSSSQVLSLATNAIVSDPFVSCRKAAVRIACASGMESEEVLKLAIGNIGKGTRFTPAGGRAVAEELRGIASGKVLEGVLTEMSRSGDAEVRRFIANTVVAWLPANAVAGDILKGLAMDTNAAVALAATNTLKDSNPRSGR